MLKMELFRLIIQSVWLPFEILGFIFFYSKDREHNGINIEKPKALEQNPVVKESILALRTLGDGRESAAEKVAEILSENPEYTTEQVVKYALRR